MQNVSHDPDQPIDLELSRAMLPLWKHLQAMEKVAAGDPTALALYEAGQRFNAAQTQDLTAQQRRNRLNPVFAKLSAASIFVDDLYEDEDGTLHLEAFGSAQRLAQRLQSAGFTVIDARQGMMNVDAHGTTTSHLYALIRIDAGELL